jgi:hypothetical protein
MRSSARLAGFDFVLWSLFCLHAEQKGGPMPNQILKTFDKAISKENWQAGMPLVLIISGIISLQNFGLSGRCKDLLTLLV